MSEKLYADPEGNKIIHPSLSEFQGSARRRVAGGVRRPDGTGRLNFLVGPGGIDMQPIDNAFLREELNHPKAVGAIMNLGKTGLAVAQLELKPPAPAEIVDLASKRVERKTSMSASNPTATDEVSS